MEDILQISLTFLCVVTAVCLIILTVYISKLVISSTKLVKSMNEACDTVNSELKPVVEDLKETVSGINSLVKTADSRVKFLNCAFNGIVGATGMLGGKLKDVMSGVIDGFKAGLNLFRK